MNGGLDDNPPFPRAAALALQHVLTMLGSTVVSIDGESCSFGN